MHDQVDETAPLVVQGVDSPLSMSNTQPCRRSFFWLSARATEG